MVRNRIYCWGMGWCLRYGTGERRKGGRVMGRHKEPDKLTRDSTAAIAAGMSYGKWMALQEHEPIKRISEDSLEDDDIDPKLRAVCQQCGREFIKQINRVQKFCCARCRQQSHYHYEKKGYAHGKSKAAGNE